MPNPPSRPRSPLLDKLDPEAEATTRAMIGGAMRTQAIYVAAKLGVADQLSLGPRTAEELAARVQAHAGSLRRILRFLVFHGVFAENDDGRFALNRAAESLQTAHPRSLRPGAIRAGENLWNLASRLLTTVRTGNTPHDELHGQSFFERHDDADQAGVLASRMSSTTSGIGEALAALDCFASARRLVDVGGSHGSLLLPLLAAHPHLQGVLFDRVSTVETARPLIVRSALGDRCALEGGDFFERVPAGDVHLLSWILHDWDDERALRILQNCREAGEGASTVIVVEALLPQRARASETGMDGTAISDPYTLDLQMMMLTGGRERTEDEYRALLERAGYTPKETIEVASQRGVSIIVGASGP